MVDMRKLYRLSIVAMLILLIVPFATRAQEVSCKIDVQGVVSTLIEAQTLAAQGNGEDALTKIAEAQAALDAINVDCSGTAAPIELTQTFTAPDEYFSFDYPKDWVIGEYDPTREENAKGGDVFFASNPGVFANVDKQPEEWSFNTGDVFAYVGVGTARAVLIDAGVYNVDNPVNDDTTFEKLVEAFRTGLVTQLNGFTASVAETFQLNDRKSASFSLDRTNFAGLVVMTELSKGKFAVTLAIGANAEADQTATYVRAIAGSMR